MHVEHNVIPHGMYDFLVIFLYCYPVRLCSRGTIKLYLLTYLLTACEHHANIMRTSCKHQANIMQTSCDHHANSMRTSCKHHANIMQTSGEHHANIMRTSCEHHANSMRTSCEHHANIMRTSCKTSREHHANTMRASMRTSCDHHANITRTSREHHANIMQTSCKHHANIKQYSDLNKQETFVRKFCSSTHAPVNIRIGSLRYVPEDEACIGRALLASIRIRFDLKTVDYLRGIKYLYFTIDGNCVSMGWGLHTGDCMGWCIHGVGLAYGRLHGVVYP